MAKPRERLFISEKLMQHGRMGQDRMSQDRLGQDRLGQDRLGQDRLDWEALRIFLIVASQRSMSAAAAELKLSVATIARRIDALERQVGASLVKRTPRGLTLTEQGEALRGKAEEPRRRMAEVERFAATLASAQQGGFIRVSATEPVISEILAPRLALLGDGQRAPRLELRVENAIVSMSLNDADIAIRLRQPEEPSLIAKRLKPIAMGLYGLDAYVAGITAGAGDDLTAAAFLSYDDNYGRIAEVRWIEDQGLAASVRIRSSSTRGLASACAAGMGLAILPKTLAATMPGLVELSLSSLSPIPERQVWAVWHRDSGRRRNVKLTLAWIGRCFAQQAAQPSMPSAGNVSSSQ